MVRCPDSLPPLRLAAHFVPHLLPHFAPRLAAVALAAAFGLTAGALHASTIAAGPATETAGQAMASVFEAYSVEMFQYRGTNQTGDSPRSESIGNPAHDPGTAAPVARLMALLSQWNGDKAITAHETAALRTAIWDIADEPDANARLRLDLGALVAEPPVDAPAPALSTSGTNLLRWQQRQRS